MKLPILSECRMAPNSIYGYSKKLRVMLPELRQNLVVEGHLISTNRTPVGRIKRKDHRAALQFRKGNRLVGCYREFEIGRLGWGGKNVRHKPLVTFLENLPTAQLLQVPLVYGELRDRKSFVCSVGLGGSGACRIQANAPRRAELYSPRN